MITFDALARELGCTLSDLDDLGVLPYTVALANPSMSIRQGLADDLRAAWRTK